MNLNKDISFHVKPDLDITYTVIFCYICDFNENTLNFLSRSIPYRED